MDKYKLLHKRSFVSSKTNKNYTIVYFLDEQGRLLDRLFPTEKWTGYGIDDSHFPEKDSFTDIYVSSDLNGYINAVSLSSK